MNNADKGAVVVAQSMLAAVGDHCGKALWRTQLAVQPLPQWSPVFVLFEQPGGHRVSGEQERSEEHTSELQSRLHLVCRLLLEKKKIIHPLTAYWLTTRHAPAVTLFDRNSQHSPNP